MRHEPLLRRRTPRSLVAILLFLTALGAMLIGFLWLAFGGSRVTAVAALAAVIALPLTIGPVDLGRWSHGWRGVVERVAVALALVLAVGTTGIALASGISALADRDALGTPAGDIVPWFVLAAVTLAGLSLLLACLPLPVGRRGTVSALGGLLVATVACLAAAGTVQGHDRCDGFAFDPDRWQAAIAGDVGPLGDDEETLAISSSLVACGTLDNLPRAEVVRLLGPPNGFGSGPDASVWSVGWADDGSGLGDVETLTVTFRDGRAVDTSLQLSEYGGAD